MSKFDIIHLDKWALKVQARADAVVKTALTNMLADIKITTGITRGGSRVRGTIPRDLGALARSLQADVIGGMAAGGSSQGETGWQAVIGSGSIGSTYRFTWGGAVAPYALHVHYGANGVPGTFWRDVAVAKFQAYVDSATAEAIRRFP